MSYLSPLLNMIIIDPNISSRYKPLKDVYTHLKKFTKHPFFIAGGAIRSLTCREPVKDYDIWSPVPNKIVDDFSSSLVVETEHSKFTNFSSQYGTIQVVKNLPIDNPHKVENIFDFTIVCAAYPYVTGVFDQRDCLVVHVNFFLDNTLKRLVVINHQSTEALFERILKFSKKGYHMEPDERAKFLKFVNEQDEINENNPVY